MTPGVSVVICTRNRARVLVRALAAVASQRVPVPFEAVVVDNGSTDDTRAVVERLAADASWLRYVHEPVTGLSHARNRGAAESRAGVIAYLDDDAEPIGGWLAALHAAFSAEIAAAVVGGPILARFECEPPRWLVGHLSLLSCQDLGPVRRRVDRPPYLFGANLAVRRDALEQLGGFDPRLGRQGARLFQDEDTDLCERALAGGKTLLYEPAAAVFHWIPPERMSRAYVRRRAFDTGRTVGLRMVRNDRRSRLIGSLAGKALKLPVHAAAWTAATLLRDAALAADRERSLFATLGILTEVLSRAREREGRAPRLTSGPDGTPS